MRVSKGTGAPIRRKKSSALSTGTPESCCLTRQGHPTHVPRRVLAQRVACRALLALAFLGEPSPLRLVPPQRLAILPRPGEAESGSAGVQPDKEYPGRRCAAGASPLKDSSSRGLFLAPADTGAMPSKTRRESCSRRHVGSCLRFGTVAGSSRGRRSCRPCTYRGLSFGRSMKITERSKRRSAFIQVTETPPWRV